MDLTVEQKTRVAAWFAAGASLDEIQKRIKAEFGVHLTYLDVRLLVADLPQPEEPDPEPETPPPAERVDVTPPPDQDPLETQPIPEEPAPADERTEAPAEEPAEGPVPNVTVTVDTIMIPGTLVSGEVTFSDGQTGKWYLDQMGRLGLGGDLPPGYRPAPADAAVFQQELMSQLQARGF